MYFYNIQCYFLETVNNGFLVRTILININAIQLFLLYFVTVNKKLNTEQGSVAKDTILILKISSKACKMDIKLHIDETYVPTCSCLERSN